MLTNKYLITDLNREIKLNCPARNESKILPKNKTGTLEILIPCTCELVQGDGKLLLSQIYPCDNTDHKEPGITHLIPNLWTNLQTLQITPITEPIRHSFINDSELLNTDWKLHVATLHINDAIRINKEHFELKHKKSDIFNNNELLMHILAIWLSIVTILLTVAFYCIVINNAKMSVLVQPSPPEEI